MFILLPCCVLTILQDGSVSNPCYALILVLIGIGCSLLVQVVAGIVTNCLVASFPLNVFIGGYRESSH
jgi:hypothetical protein